MFLNLKFYLKKNFKESDFSVTYIRIFYISNRLTEMYKIILKIREFSYIRSNKKILEKSGFTFYKIFSI